MAVWITEEHVKEAIELMEKWEKQGCTYEEVETKIAALDSLFKKSRNQIDKEPFKIPSQD